MVEGGTAVDSTSKAPLAAIIVVGLVGLGVIAWLALRGGDKKPTTQADQPTAAQEAPANVVEAPSGPEAPTTPTNTRPSAPDPGTVTDRLERALKRERLWSTVTFDGNRVEIRSGSCSDPARAPSLNATAPSLKAAGLTRLRCLEQSGAVVTDRDL